MAIAQDLINELIKRTESGKMEWEAIQAEGGCWMALREGWSFEVGQQDERVAVTGYGVWVELGQSTQLVAVLQARNPIAPSPTKEEALRFALQSLKS